MQVLMCRVCQIVGLTEHVMFPIHIVLGLTRLYHTSGWLYTVTLRLSSCVPDTSFVHALLGFISEF